MKPWGTEHCLYIAVSIVVVIVVCLLTKKAKPIVQNIIFMIIALCGSLGIFFRYGLRLSFENSVTWDILLKQLLQVCNFNFILLPAAAFTKSKLIRNYLFSFSMFAASTAFVSYSKSLYKLQWNDISFINFWMNHLMAILLPLAMLASGQFKPEKKYVLGVSILVFVYFSVSAFGSWYLMEYEGLKRLDTFSFVFVPDGIPILEFLYSLIPIYFVYLLPLYPILIAWFYVLAWLFDGKKEKSGGKNDGKRIN